LKDLSYNFSLIKPDGISFLDQIVEKFSSASLQVQVGKKLRATTAQIERHFKIKDAAHTMMMGKLLFGNCVSYDFPVTKFQELIGFPVDAPAFSLDEVYKKAGEVLFGINKKYFLSGQLIPLLISGEGDVISQTRKITGATNQVAAEKGTIRYDFSQCDLKKTNMKLEPCANIIHTSGNSQERDVELEIWWPGNGRH
jgi:nucleoside diphosphate kinase